MQTDIAAGIAYGGQSSAAGEPRNFLADSSAFTTTIDGIDVWDTQSWRLDRQLSSSLAGTDVSPTPDCTVVVHSEDGSLGVISLAGYTTFPLYGASRSVSLDALGVDAEGKFFGVAERSGVVDVFELLREEFVLAAQFRQLEVSNPIVNGQFAHAVAFDPTRRYLAVLIGKRLAIFFLQTGQMYFVSVIVTRRTPSTALMFDRSGRILATGSIDGWQLWDVKERVKLLGLSEPPVYALDFNISNDLFAFGDANGTVHVWGFLTQ